MLGKKVEEYKQPHFTQKGLLAESSRNDWKKSDFFIWNTVKLQQSWFLVF